MALMLGSCELPLGFNILEVLLHMFNLALLIIAMRFLVYKPVKKFIDKRKAEYQAEEDNAKRTREEAEQLKAKYEDMLNNAKEDADKITRNAVENATVKADEIINTAQVEAKKIVDGADKEVEKAKEKARQELASSVSDIAVDMAKKILEREVTAKDNDAVIDDVLNNWNKK